MSIQVGELGAVPAAQHDGSFRLRILEGDEVQFTVANIFYDHFGYKRVPETGFDQV